MFTKEMLEGQVAAAKAYTAKCYRELPEATGFQPVVSAWHEGQPQVWLFPDLDGDPNPGAKIAQTAWFLAANTLADTVVVTCDITKSKAETKKDNTEWQRGDMQKARRDNTEDADSIVDAAQVFVMDRLGDAMCWIGTYSVSDDRQVSWDEEDWYIEGEEGSEADLYGMIPEAMRRGFAKPSIIDIITSETTHREELGELDEAMRLTLGDETPPVEVVRDFIEQMRDNPRKVIAMQVCSMVRTFAELGVSMVVGSDDPGVLEIYARHLGTPDDVFSASDEEEA